MSSKNRRRVVQSAAASAEEATELSSEEEVLTASEEEVLTASEEEEDETDEEEEEYEDEEPVAMAQTSPTGEKIRKPRKKSSPRPRFFSCVAYNPNSKEENRIAFDLIESWDEQKARDFFKKKHGVAPDKLVGPLYIVRNTGKSEAQRITVTLTSALEALTNLTGQQYKCLFGGWRCIGNVIGETTSKDGQKFEKGQLITLQPYEYVDPSKKTHKPRMASNEVVRLADVQIESQI
jgi:hypothetical protein